MTFFLKNMLPIAVGLVCTILVMSGLYAKNAGILSTAVTLDLVVTAPLLYWLAGGTWRAAIRVFVLGVLTAGLLLRSGPHSLLDGIRIWVSPVVEGWVIWMLVRGLYRGRRAGMGGLKGGDLLVRGRMILGEALGNRRMGDIVMSEIAVMYYAFCRGRSVPAGALSFSNYKGNSIRLVLGVFLCCMMVETVGVHFLIGIWSSKAAWVMTALGAYTMLQLFAHIRAVKSRPILVSEGYLTIRNGLAGDARIAMNEIAEVHVVKGVKGRPAEGEVRMGLLGALEAPNICIRLRCEIEVARMFGIRRKGRAIFFYVDGPEEFCQTVRGTE